MKVKDLIIELQKHSPDAEVLVDGYEMGVSDVRKVVPIIAYKNVERPHWHGRYETSLGGEYTPADAQPISAVFLPRLDHEDSCDWNVKWPTKQLREGDTQADVSERQEYLDIITVHTDTKINGPLS